MPQYLSTENLLERRESLRGPKVSTKRDQEQPQVAWVETEEDHWLMDSSLPASESITELPGEAETQLPTPEPVEEEPEVQALDDQAEISEDEKKRRSKTIARKQMLRERRRMVAQGTLPEVVDYERPVRREECRTGKRPCLYVSCRYHLYLDVNPVTGSIKINFPDKEIWQLSQTCALDVAERGGITLEEVGDIMNLTRERIRQVEVSGLGKLREGEVSLESFLDGRELPSARPGLPIVGE